jgi:hypothetical protein
MSAHVNTSSVVYLPTTLDENFLGNVTEQLEQLRVQCEVRGHPLLASLLAIAKGEAEDGLKTHATVQHVRAQLRELDDGAVSDDGVVQMAEKLAYRTKRRP